MVTLCDLLTATGGHYVGPQGHAPPPCDDSPSRVTTDSRSVRGGDIFWALRGHRFKGETFCGDAFARGAGGCVVPRGAMVVPPPHAWVVEVDDTTLALRRLAASHRRRHRAAVVGVTGSVGKTTTREMIRAVLQRKGPTVATCENRNNGIGVPLSLLNIEPEHRHAVIEMGANRPGEIADLAAIAEPDLGVITRVADAHLGPFGGPNGVLSAKCELLAALALRGGAAVLHHDPRLILVAQTLGIAYTTFGEDAAATFPAREVAWRDGLLRFQLHGQRVAVPVWGRHFLGGVLAALAVGQYFNISLADAVEALQQWQPPDGRCRVGEHNGVTLIDDTYNASPTATRAALELLASIECRGRRIAVLGDMLELGEEAQHPHIEAGRHVAGAGVDRLVACGDLATWIAHGARDAGLDAEHIATCATSLQAARLAAQWVVPGDVVLVKGSRAMRMEHVVQELTKQKPGEDGMSSMNTSQGLARAG